MKNFFVAIFASACCMLQLGCAVTLPTTSYTPQNYVKISGVVDVSTFKYQPFIDGKVKLSNQVQNTAVGKLYLSMDVAEFAKRGTALELEKSGVQLQEGAAIKLEGDVIEFMCDDLGYSAHFKYSIQYKIIDVASSQVLFDKTFIVPQKKIGKFGDAITFVSVASEMVLAGYDLFIRDSDVKRIFESSLRQQGSRIMESSSTK